MARSRVIVGLCMHVFIQEHIEQLFFFFRCKTASVYPVLWIFVGPEQHVPPNNVAVVIFVAIGLMLGAIQFVPLVEVAQANFREGSASFAEVQSWAFPPRSPGTG